MKSYIIALVIAVFMAITTVPMAAETEKEEKKVEASEKKPETPMDALVVSATRTENTAFHVPASVTVVGADQIKQEQYSSVADLLGTIPGVDIAGEFGHQKQPALRGLPESQTIIKIDGARQNYVQDSGDAQSTILVDPDILKEVEVSRGPSSVMHGGGGIGGVISLKTMDAADLLKPGQNMGAKIKTGFSTADESNSVSATAYGRHKDFDILASSTLRTYGDYESSAPDESDRETTMDGETRNNMVKFSFQPSQGQKIGLNLMNYSHEYEYPEDELKYESRQNRVIGKYELSKGSPWLNLEVTALYSVRDEEQNRPHPFGGDIENELEFTSAGVDIQNTMTFSTWGTNHRLMAGFDYYRDDYEPKTTDSQMAYANPPGYGEDWGGFVQDEIFLTDTLCLTAGMRYTYYSRSRDDSTGSDGSESRFSPRVALDWTPFEWLGMYSGYSEAFRPPLVSEMFTELDVMYGPMHILILANPDLEPEVAKTWEWGARLSFDDLVASSDALRIKGSFFKEKITDMITIQTLQEIDPPASMDRIVTTVNLNSVKRYGGELELAYATKNFTFTGGYSRVMGHDNENGTNEGETPGIFNLRADYNISSCNLKLGWRSRFVESFETDADSYKSYDVHSLSLVWSPKFFNIQDLDLFFGVSNLFDKSYEAYHFKGSAPGMARNYRAGISYKF